MIIFSTSDRDASCEASLQPPVSFTPTRSCPPLSNLDQKTTPRSGLRNGSPCSGLSLVAPWLTIRSENSAGLPTLFMQASARLPITAAIGAARAVLKQKKQARPAQRHSARTRSVLVGLTSTGAPPSPCPRS